MTLVPCRGFVGSGSPQCGASLALSGMDDPNPCIPLSARESAGGARGRDERFSSLMTSACLAALTSVLKSFVTLELCRGL